MKVGEVMTCTIHSVSSGRSVLHASELMERFRIGSLLVVDAGTVTGILTSRDVRTTHPNRIVADAMTADPIGTVEDAFVWDALNLMAENGIERLLVRSKDGSPSGIVTRETLASRIAELTDPMTGLFRSDYLEAIALDLIARGQPFHFLFIDLNDFGVVNKRFGHPVGDDLICGFAGKLKSVFSEEDCLCRYAGDEFAVLSKRPPSFIRDAVGTLADGFSVGPAHVSASVGWLDAGAEPDLGKLTFRELVLRASLMSTERKAGKV